jgi:ferrous iron transport protein B
VANYPGVTVEARQGHCYSQHGKRLCIVDLPGGYDTIARSPDEDLLQNVLLGAPGGGLAPQGVICTISALQLEKGLHWAHLLMELGYPMLVVVTLLDVAATQGLQPNLPALEAALGGVRVLPFDPRNRRCLDAILIGLSQLSLPAQADVPPHHDAWSRLSPGLPALVQEALGALQATGPMPLSPGQALWLLSQGSQGSLKKPWQTAVMPWVHTLQDQCPQWHSELQQQRQATVASWAQAAKDAGNSHLPQPSPGRQLGLWLDKVLLHPVGGPLSLLACLGALFWALFTLPAYPMQGIAWGVDQTLAWGQQHLPDNALTRLLTEGVVAGVGNVLLFLPQILTLFFLLGLWESSGYMTRALAVLEGFMRRFGLPGRAFIPLLSSHACAIPGILATRTLSSPQERLATLLVAPWTSCSARLPVYLLMIHTLLPSPKDPWWLKGALLVLAYAVGLGSALGGAWVLRKTLLRGGPASPRAWDMPPLLLPSLRYLVTDLVYRAKAFLWRAGTVIVLFSVVLWGLMHYPWRPDLPPAQRLAQTWAGRLGKGLEPVFAPLGYDWKISVALVSSFAARELFPGTLAILYHSEDQAVPVEDCGCGCCNAKQPSRYTLSRVLLNQKRPDGQRVYHAATCASLLVFYIFALQCSSTVAVVRRETGSWAWTLGQWAVMCTVAYVAAWLTYRLMGGS